MVLEQRLVFWDLPCDDGALNYDEIWIGVVHSAMERPG